MPVVSVVAVVAGETTVNVQCHVEKGPNKNNNVQLVMHDSHLPIYAST